MFFENGKKKDWIILLLIFCGISYAQQKDTILIYRKIQKFAYKHKFTTWLYHTTFVDPQPIEYPTQPTAPAKEEKIVNPYLKYEGRIIKKINVIVRDPFGHSVNDPYVKKVNPLQKLANRGHFTTRHWVISNKLLFKEKDTLNALAISESERLLRQTNYVSDARIAISEVSHSDSIEIDVIVQDKWTVTAEGEATETRAHVKFRNQNLLGLGQQFEQYVGYHRPDQMDYNCLYNVSNIDNTYISALLSYQTSKDGTDVGLNFDRSFYSPLTKWAGGVGFNKGQYFYYFTDSLDRADKKISLENFSYDVWLGKSIKLEKTKSFFNSSTNIIVGARYYNTTYYNRPKISNDIRTVSPNTWAYIGNIGFAVQQYYKDKFIYRFGANEDVPEGLIVQYFYGIDNKELRYTRYYTAFEIARAKHFRWGYVSATFSHGIFFNRSISNDITTNYRMNYFTDLFRLGKWYLRSFVNYNLIYGENKQPEERITIRSDELYGFKSGELYGTKKMIANIENVAYAPYNLIGFRFAGVLMIGAGMIGDVKRSIFQSNLYQAYSLGLMVRNENLVSSTFQISVGAYPFLPDRKDFLFVYNPVVSFTLRVRSFSVSKPAFLSY
jgi:hypothetical protein